MSFTTDLIMGQIQMWWTEMYIRQYKRLSSLQHWLEYVLWMRFAFLYQKFNIWIPRKSFHGIYFEFLVQNTNSSAFIFLLLDWINDGNIIVYFFCLFVECIRRAIKFYHEQSGDSCKLVSRLKRTLLCYIYSTFSPFKLKAQKHNSILFFTRIVNKSSQSEFLILVDGKFTFNMPFHTLMQIHIMAGRNIILISISIYCVVYII